MKNVFSVLIVIFCVCQCFAQSDSIVSIENENFILEYNLLRGNYKMVSVDKKTIFLSDGILKVNTPFSDLRSDHIYNRKASIENIKDEIGTGKLLTVRMTADNVPGLIQQFFVYDKNPFLIINAGIINTYQYEMRISEIHTVVGKIYSELSANTISELCMLDGNGGGDPTEVKHGDRLKSRNNILVTFKSGDSRHSLVCGGITYHEFEKFSEVKKTNNGFSLDSWNHDDYGKLLKPGQVYIPDDKTGLCFSIIDPFTALEIYGNTLKTAQHVKLNCYDFPTVCLWYASHEQYGGGEKLNSSSGAVKEMQNIKNTGFLKYSRAAVRLVPDCYEVNNQQGWWDDEHWQKISNDACCAVSTCYDKPYETSEKWGRAVTELGGIPLTYFQTAARSEDFCDAYPQYMLYNNPVLGKIYLDYHLIWQCFPYLSYDFTDSGFVKHVQAVYAHLKDAGIKGMMFDYPFTGWSTGGYDDPYVTASAVYRKIFALAHDGLDDENYVDERNCAIPYDKGSDITLGMVASQRTMGDNDLISPQSVSISGLRWYKNRVVVSYDADAKNPFHLQPSNRDTRRALYTMTYVATGRLLLGVSFAKMDKDNIYDLSRTFPYHTSPQSARPIDAFISADYPSVYDFKVNNKWHQVTLYNFNIKSGKWPTEWSEYHNGFKVEQAEKTFSVNLAIPNFDGGMALNADKEYYFYDFWNDTFIGRMRGDKILVQTVRPGEARMISVHEVEGNPQFLSTNRHIMQGYIDMKECKWNASENELNGTSAVVGGEPYKIIIALNGYTYISSKIYSAKIKVSPVKENKNLMEVCIETDENKNVEWNIKFKK